MTDIIDPYKEKPVAKFCGIENHEKLVREQIFYLKKVYIQDVDDRRALHIKLEQLRKQKQCPDCRERKAFSTVNIFGEALNPEVNIGLSIKLMTVHERVRQFWVGVRALVGR